MSGGHYDAAREYDIGVDDLNAQRFHEAAQHFDRALLATPKDPTLLTVYGLALEGMKQWSNAERAFALALSVDKDRLVARRERALILIRLGRLEDARSELKTLEAETAACDDDCRAAMDLHSAVDRVRAALGAASAGAPPAAGRSDPAL
jgi:Flp pilus assembly protein TadD